MRPEYGCAIHDYVFATIDPDTAGRISGEVRSALVRWEPRIEVQGVDVTIDPKDQTLCTSTSATRSATPTTHGTWCFPSTRFRRRNSMALPIPNLDDRRFQELVNESKRMVQQKCPEWTDHNVHDPGVTLIESSFRCGPWQGRAGRNPNRIGSAADSQNVIGARAAVGGNRFTQ